MKKAFTMIELIFVIVIIGILAAVAIPKLAATRDDAKIANIITNARTLLRDAPAYYTSQGASVWDGALAVSVTNVPLTVGDCVTPIDPTTDLIQGTYLLCDERVADGEICLTFDINETAINIQGGAGTSVICNGVLGDPATIGMTGGADSNKTIILGGVGVER